MFCEQGINAVQDEPFCGCWRTGVEAKKTLGLLKIKVFWNKSYDVKISVHDVTIKILLLESNHVVDVVISKREVIIASIL